MAQPGEITEEERQRRRELAERIGTAPGAPQFSLGPSRNPYTPGLRVAHAGMGSRLAPPAPPRRG